MYYIHDKLLEIKLSFLLIIFFVNQYHVQGCHTLRILKITQDIWIFKNIRMTTDWITQYIFIFNLKQTQDSFVFYEKLMRFSWFNFIFHYFITSFVENIDIYYFLKVKKSFFKSLKNIFMTQGSFFWLKEPCMCIVGYQG